MPAGETVEIEQRAETILEEHVSGLELSNGGGGDRSRWDFIGRSPAGAMVVQVKATNRKSVDAMRGQLATGILEVREYFDSSDKTAVVLLHAPRVGGRALTELEKFMAEYASAVAWGVFDDRGTVHLEIHQLGVEISKLGDSDSEASRRTTHNTQAFTDLNRWLLKVLMLRDVPYPFWKRGDEWRTNFSNPSDLNSVADVSQSKAYQFARTFRDMGLLKWTRGEFQLLDRRRVFERWFEVEQQTNVERFPVRRLIPTDEPPLAVFEDVGNAVGYAVGGFEACRIYDELHTASRTPEVYVFDEPARVREYLDLQRCAEHEAEFYLVRTPHEQSVARGGLVRENRRVVDILQAALDVGRHPGRGREQSEYLVEHVLGW